MVVYEESQAKARILMEALPYVRRFRGSIFVVKYGGSFMDSPDPEVRSGVAKDLVFLNFVGIKVVVVHGGGKAITRELKERGIQARFIDGLRVTDEQTIDAVDSVLNEQVNREVADFVSSHDCEVQRFPGKQVLSCEKLQSKNDLGFVGHGVCYNVNADNVASQVAMALGARRLVYLSDVPGLLRNPEDPSTLLSSLAISEVKPLEEAGVISAGMLPKVTSAVEALKAGVNRVHFIDGRMPHSILLEIFTDQGIGTEIVHA